MKYKISLIFCLLFLVVTGCQWGANKPALVELTPMDASLNLGGTQEFTATVRNRSGEIISTVEPEWILGDPIGTLSASTGNTVTFHATTKGSSYLKVVAGNVVTKGFIVVSELNLTYMKLVPANFSIGIGQKQVIELVGEDQFGNPLYVSDPIAEISTNIGTFDPVTRTFTATSAGTGTITISAQGIEASATITVEEQIHFPDPALDSLVRQAIGKNATDPLFPYEFLGVKELDLRGQNVASLEGLQYCVNLKRLLAANNNISDVKPLENLFQLTHLDLQNNLVTSIMPLRMIHGLEILRLGYNPITDFDELAYLTNLLVLDLTNTELTTTVMLQQLDQLRELYLGYNNGINDISALAVMTNLRVLNISGYIGSDITPLIGKTQLRVLELRGTLVSDLSPLSECTALEELYLDNDSSGGYINNIEPLANLTNLKKLNLTANAVSDITPLLELTNLTNLYLTNNLITDIQPLVDNAGINAGDVVFVDGNLLDLTEGSDARLDIQILESRGVYLIWELESSPSFVE